MTPIERKQHEEALEGLLSQLTRKLSKLARMKVLPEAKFHYEELHPETKHGGRRTKKEEKQEPNFRTWPPFVRHVAETCGLSEGTIRNRLDDAEVLRGLSPRAEKACDGNPIANQPRYLVRIARIANEELQVEVVEIFFRNRKAAAKRLTELEVMHGLRAPSDANSETADGEEDRGDIADSEANESQPAADDAVEEPFPNFLGYDDAGDNKSEADDERDSDDLPALFETLGVSNTHEALSAARNLATEVTSLKKERDRLRKELDALHNMPFAKIFSALGVKSTSEALEMISHLKEVSHAAQ